MFSGLAWSSLDERTLVQLDKKSNLNWTSVDHEKRQNIVGHSIVEISKKNLVDYSSNYLESFQN